MWYRVSSWARCSVGQRRCATSVRFCWGTTCVCARWEPWNICTKPSGPHSKIVKHRPFMLMFRSLAVALFYLLTNIPLGASEMVVERDDFLSTRDSSSFVSQVPRESSAPPNHLLREWVTGSRDGSENDYLGYATLKQKTPIKTGLSGM